MSLSPRVGWPRSPLCRQGGAGGLALLLPWPSVPTPPLPHGWPAASSRRVPCIPSPCMRASAIPNNKQLRLCCCAAPVFLSQPCTRTSPFATQHSRNTAAQQSLVHSTPASTSRRGRGTRSVPAVGWWARGKGQGTASTGPELPGLAGKHQQGTSPAPGLIHQSSIARHHALRRRLGTRAQGGQIQSSQSCSSRGGALLLCSSFSVCCEVSLQGKTLLQAPWRQRSSHRAAAGFRSR